MSIIQKTAHTIARWLNWVAASAIVAVMLVVCVNVLGRGLFGAPLKGTVDMVSLFGAFVIAGAMAYTQVLKGHIRITLFIQFLPRLLRVILACLMDFMGMILFGVISWQAVLFAKGTHEIGELSEVLKVPIAPFAFMVSVGCMALTLVLLVDLIHLLSKEVKR
jgi:TRAP-type C4-dicarboxylate transport system permease small subunit